MDEYLQQTKDRLKWAEELLGVTYEQYDRELLKKCIEDLKISVNNIERWSNNQEKIRARTNGFVQSEDANGCRRAATGKETL